MKYPHWLKEWAKDISLLELIAFAAFIVILFYKVYANWPLILIAH